MGSENTFAEVVREVTTARDAEGSLEIAVATKATRSKIKQIYKVRWSLFATVNYINFLRISCNEGGGVRI